MTEPQASSQPPPGGPRPPAPPTVGDPPGSGPDPADPGPPITVRLDDLLLGDLGNPRVDARLLRAVLLRDGRMAEWLRSRGSTAAPTRHDGEPTALTGQHARTLASIQPSESSP